MAKWVKLFSFSKQQMILLLIIISIFVVSLLVTWLTPDVVLVKNWQIQLVALVIYILCAAFALSQFLATDELKDYQTRVEILQQIDEKPPPYECARIIAELLKKLDGPGKSAYTGPLLGGFSGSKVWLTTGKDKYNSPYTWVIKVDKHEKIKGECDGFHSIQGWIRYTTDLKSDTCDENSSYAGVAWKLAASGKDTRLYTLAEHIKAGARLRAVTQTLFDVILKEMCKEQSERQIDLMASDQYELNETKVNKIRDSLTELWGLLPLIGFDRLSNPVDYWEQISQMNWVRHTIVRPVHGDLNARNILVESSGNIQLWLIDFEHAQQNGHGLKDFAKYEVELKFVLCSPTWQNLQNAVNIEKMLLYDTNNVPFATVEAFCAPNLPVGAVTTEFEDLVGAVKYSRKRAWDYGPHVDTFSVEEYYLALLRYTLPILYYQQCNDRQKLYALISASLICDALIRLLK